ncbi:MAG: hypothetical protein H6726_03270 [Sandaracinaceae bacterium]|nr:hypothetical protein [Sandaracinaceae bacterium]
MVGCANAGCPVGTVLDDSLGQCIRVGDMGVLDLGMDASPPDLLPDLGPDLGPCGACGPDTECNPDTNTCVPCLTAAHCSAPLDQCTSMNTCVECINDGHCEGSTPYCVANACEACRNNSHCPLTDPVCNTVDHTCGSCQQRSDCNDRSATPACNTSTGDCTLCDIDSESADCPGQRCFNQTSCTECRPGTASVDCTMPSKPQCNTIGECAACTMDDHCSHISGRPRCVSGTCRACTLATEGTDCGANSCNPATLTCTTTPRFSRSVCESCVSDTECIQGGPGNTFRCVPMNFQGTGLGGFCLREAPGCSAPYAVPIVNVVSLSGATASNYCGLNQTVTSCSAVRVMIESRPCPGGTDDECMVPGGRCETVGSIFDQCTYGCSVANECVSGFFCNAGYCGS